MWWYFVRTIAGQQSAEVLSTIFLSKFTLKVLTTL